MKNLNEEIKRIKSLFTEERLYGNLVDKKEIITEQWKTLGDIITKLKGVTMPKLDLGTFKTIDDAVVGLVGHVNKNIDMWTKILGGNKIAATNMENILDSMLILGNLRHNTIVAYNKKYGTNYDVDINKWGTDPINSGPNKINPEVKVEPVKQEVEPEVKQEVEPEVKQEVEPEVKIDPKKQTIVNVNGGVEEANSAASKEALKLAGQNESGGVKIIRTEEYYVGNKKQDMISDKTAGEMAEEAVTDITSKGGTVSPKDKKKLESLIGKVFNFVSPKEKIASTYGIDINNIPETWYGSFLKKTTTGALTKFTRLYRFGASMLLLQGVAAGAKIYTGWNGLKFILPTYWLTSIFGIPWGKLYGEGFCDGLADFSNTDCDDLRDQVSELSKSVIESIVDGYVKDGGLPCDDIDKAFNKTEIKKQVIKEIAGKWDSDIANYIISNIKWKFLDEKIDEAKTDMKTECGQTTAESESTVILWENDEKNIELY